MDLKIKNDKQQKLLDRRTIMGEIYFSGEPIPSREKVIKELAKQLKIKENQIIIKEISNKFGSTTAQLEAHVYESQEIKNKLEPKHLLKRSEIKAVVKKEKKEETKPKVKEEAKEEVKEETKPKVKEEAKEEVKEETKPKAEVKEEAKPEVKAEPKAEEKKE